MRTVFCPLSLRGRERESAGRSAATSSQEREADALVTAEDDEVGLDRVERRLEPLEAVHVGADGAALDRAHLVEVTALARPDREVQVGGLKDCEVAGVVEAEDGRGRKFCERGGPS